MTPLTLVKLINRTYPLLHNFFMSFFFFFSLFVCFVVRGEGRGTGGREVRRVEMGCVKVKEMFWME